MRTFPLVLLALLVWASGARSQGHRPAGARIQALSGASAALPSEIWPGAGNPASLAGCSSVSAAAFVRPALFGLSELRTVGLALACPLGRAVLASELYRFGFELYNEAGLSVGCGWRAAPGLALGGSVHARVVNIARYGRRLEATADVGAIAEFWSDVWVGLGVRSVAGDVILLPGQDLPSSLYAGVAVSARENTLVLAECEREENHDLTLRLAFEFCPLEALAVRAGWGTHPDCFSAGAALRFGGLECAYAALLHGELGWTHAVEIGFSLGS